MHYTVAITELIFAPRRAAQRRATARAETTPSLRSTRIAGAWHNWWAMSVEEPPAIGARQTRRIGARGRMVVPPR